MIHNPNSLHLEALTTENLQLKQELAQLTAIGTHNASYIQPTGVVKRPHYYMGVGNNPFLKEQEVRIAELSQMVARQNQQIRLCQAGILGVQRHFHNILKIDQDIYKKLESVSPNVRTLEEVKLAVKRGESREFIGQILDRIVI